MLHIPWQTTAASSFDIHCSDKVIEQLRREGSEPLHPTSVRWELNLPANKPLGRATAPIWKEELVTSQCTYDAHYKVSTSFMITIHATNLPYMSATNVCSYKENETRENLPWGENPSCEQTTEAS